MNAQTFIGYISLNIGNSVAVQFRKQANILFDLTASGVKITFLKVKHLLCLILCEKTKKKEVNLRSFEA